MAKGREGKKAERLADLANAEAVRALAGNKSETPETGRWEAKAFKARLALARAAEAPSRSKKSGWKMGKAPSAKG